jgi:hypothetical protein
MSTQNINKILCLTNLIDSRRHETLANFLLSCERDELAALRQENIDLLFAEAKKHKVRFIFVGTEEICGCENKYDQCGWPAMWAIAKAVGFPRSCGNADQYQCHNAGKVFPADSYGAWDLKSSTKLTREEIDKKKFRFVVTRTCKYV